LATSGANRTLALGRKYLKPNSEKVLDYSWNDASAKGFLEQEWRLAVLPSTGTIFEWLTLRPEVQAGVSSNVGNLNDNVKDSIGNDPAVNTEGSITSGPERYR
jgi:hypothetical protein